MHTITRFKGTLYPDKSFSLGALPSPKKNASNRGFKDSLVHLRSKECETLFYDLEQLLELGLLTWGRYVEVVINNEYVRIGAVGVMNDYMCAMYSG